MRVLFGLLAVLLALPFSAAEAQRCPMRGLFYIVRDRTGEVLDETELNALKEQSPPPVGKDAGMFIGSVSGAGDGTYWSARDPPIIPVLYFHGVPDDCQLHLTEATLVQGRQRMRLVFNVTLDLATPSPDAGAVFPPRPRAASPSQFFLGAFLVVDSPPFKDGTFELDLSGWRAAYKAERGIPAVPAEFWRPVRPPN